MAWKVPTVDVRAEAARVEVTIQGQDGTLGVLAVGCFSISATNLTQTTNSHLTAVVQGPRHSSGFFV